MTKHNDWTINAIEIIERDYRRSADTHLVPLPPPDAPGIKLYIKDESTHPTGSLKHRLARSLFLYALCNGWIDEHSTVVEASSGSTAVSEAYFARMLGLPFIAVMPRSTARAKVEKIEFYGGRCHFVDRSGEVYAEAQRLADACGGHYMDQFTYAERATDWRGNNNIAESIYDQMQEEEHAVPEWIVTGAGTGGTSATIGRYIRYRKLATRLCVVDPENSVFLDHFESGDPDVAGAAGSRIEGIGRPRVEPSFVRGVIDRMLRVPDAASLAAIRFLEKQLGRRYGGSTGTGFYGALLLACEMKRTGKAGSIVLLACDDGDRYLDTYYDDRWIADNNFGLAPYTVQIEEAFASCRWPELSLELCEEGLAMAP